MALTLALLLETDMQGSQPVCYSSSASGVCHPLPHRAPALTLGSVSAEHTHTVGMRHHAVQETPASRPRQEMGFHPTLFLQREEQEPDPQANGEHSKEHMSTSEATEVMLIFLPMT